MRTETRIAFNAYAAQLAALNGVPAATTKFTVAPTVEQTLEDRIQQNADFLGRINIIGVAEQSAQILGLGTNAPAAGRTNTTVNTRQPRAITNLTERGYTCRQTNFDTYVTYQQLDMWAKFPDFQARIRNHVTLQIARDRLTIGWNGTSAAAETDIAANPLLQDVNVGWLQHIRADAPERVLSDIKVGTAAGSDYRNLDALVLDAAGEMLAEWYQEDPDIVVLMGRSLLTDKYLGLLNSADADAPTEKAAMNTLLLNKTVGGRRAELVPFFPATSLLITRPSNLSIYWQTGSHRRHIKDEPERDRIVDYASDNEDYVIEDLEACAFVDGILSWNGDAWV